MRGYSRFSAKNAQNFVAMATRVDVGQILMAPWDQLPSKTRYGANISALSAVEAEL